MKSIVATYRHERAIYLNLISFVVNTLLFPFKMIIPQPVIAKIPGLTTNLMIRTQLVLNEVQGALLDIGCGTNELVKRYRESGGNGTGVDVYPWKGVDHVVENSAALPLGDNSIDTVTFVACLNHIPNREETLTEAHRVLNNNGRLVVTNITPFISRIWHAYAFWDHDQHERGMEEGEVFGFTTKEMQVLLTRSGYQIEKMVRFSWGLNQLYVCRPVK